MGIAFKCMEVVLRGLTAFIGSFMVSSGVAYFVSKYIIEDNANVMSMVEFFETNKDIKSLESQCHLECFISLGVWGCLFLSGLIYQYKCSFCKRRSRNSHNAPIAGIEESYSDDSRPVIINHHNHYHQPKGSKGYVQMG